MASSLPTHNNGQPQVLQNEEETPHLRSLHRRTPSFPSSSPTNSSSFRSSSSFSLNEEFPPFSPSTPLNKFKGIPFSWEHIPGIPKRQDSIKKAPSSHLLPLPPAGNSIPGIKKSIHVEEISPKKCSTVVKSLHRDPFFAALVECSKDEDHDQGSNIWKGSKIARTLIDRVRFINMYASCKRSCAVSESMVYLPRSTPHYLLNRRSS